MQFCIFMTNIFILFLLCFRQSAVNVLHSRPLKEEEEDPALLWVTESNAFLKSTKHMESGCLCSRALKQLPPPCAGDSTDTNKTTDMQWSLQCFDTVHLVTWPVKIVPEMNYNVLSGTLSLYTTASWVISWKWSPCWVWKICIFFLVPMCPIHWVIICRLPLPSIRQHLSYDDYMRIRGKITKTGLCCNV